MLTQLVPITSARSQTWSRITWPQWFPAEAVVFLILWISLLALMPERAFYDPGSLWHVVVGEIILTQGMPQSDPFSYTCAGQRWVPQQWGAEVLMALLHRVGQLDLLLLAFTAGLAGLYTWIFHRTLQDGMAPLLAFLLVAICLFAGAFHYYVRPHMVTIAGMAWTMAIVIDAEKGCLPRWRLYSLPAVYMVWTNLHGGVLGGLMMLGLAAGAWGSIFLVRRYGSLPYGHTPFQQWSDVKRWVIVLIGCALAPLVNPHGLEMFRIWQSIVGSTVLPRVVGEHMPLDPSRPFAWPVLALACVYGLLLVSAISHLRFSWLLPLMWLVLSFQSIRQAPLFAVTVAIALPALWSFTPTYRFLLAYGDGSLVQPPTARRWRPAMVGIPLLAVGLAFCVQQARCPIPVIGADWARLSTSVTPIELKEQLQRYAASVPPGTPIFNDANFGGFLIYFTPTLKIFMDDRCELYGDAWLEYYADTLALPPEQLGPIFEHWQQRYGFTHALIAATTPASSLERYLLYRSDRWHEVARCQAAILFALRPQQPTDINAMPSTADTPTLSTSR
ncbi:MAG: hypothetical protein NZU63_08250 [Gemmataceae bacterium]|nr:hypothetical protein [Gemmataceae bacterium]